ncbi:MAG: hypothetical protein CMJ64_03165 [Planctomycetaceae bacterium]|nr:hypothetical protein [Planctomycetaceae bacterium]
MSVPETLDQRLASALWDWADASEQSFDDGPSVQECLASLLESFLCDAFTYWPHASRQGWWSDGVIELHLERISPTAIRAFGSTYWAGSKSDEFGDGPFEIEFYFVDDHSLGFARTVVRFGWKDKDGIITKSSSIHPRLRKQGRQFRNSEWAMAIELKPPKNT